MARKSASVTLKDIAQQAGVSHTAVSAALHDTGRISDEKRKQILAVARKMNYQPSMAAQMLRSKRTGHLGLIICGTESADCMDSGFFGPIISNFIGACEQRDTRYRIEFVNQNAYQDDGFIPPATFAGGMVDGALVAGYYEQPFAHWLNHENKRAWVGIGEPAKYFVKDDSYKNTYMALQHLAAIGHKRIALLHGDVSFRSNEEGVLGFEQGCKDFHLQVLPQWVQYIPVMPRRIGIQQTAAWAKQHLSKTNRPTAVICKGMGLARAVVSVAQQLRLDVPGQLSVLGAGTQAESERSYPCMAFVQPNYQVIVEQGLFMLEQLLAGRKVQSTQQLVPANMIWNDTVAPPPLPEVAPEVVPDSSM